MLPPYKTFFGKWYLLVTDEYSVVKDGDMVSVDNEPYWKHSIDTVSTIYELKSTLPNLVVYRYCGTYHTKKGNSKPCMD